MIVWVDLGSPHPTETACNTPTLMYTLCLKGLTPKGEFLRPRHTVHQWKCRLYIYTEFSDVNVPSIAQGHLYTGLRSMSVLQIHAAVSLNTVGSNHRLFALPLRASVLSLGLTHRCRVRGSVSGLLSAIVIFTT